MYDKIKILFPDKSIREYPKGTTGLAIAESISLQLKKKVLATKINNTICDSTLPIEKDADIQLLTWGEDEGKSTLWHSSAHLMAEAIEALFPNVKFGIGPAIDKGFYYDVDLGDYVLTEEDIKNLEKKILELAQQQSQYTRKPISKKEALAYFFQKKDPYKIELIEGLNDGEITLYTQGNFTDLCRGPHIPHTGFIKAVKILNIAGAYWRGDEKRKMLTRLYGITFPTQKELEEYLVWLQESKQRDHRKIGKELELFAFSERVGMGLPLWLPKGATVRNELQNFMQKAQLDRGYLPVITPHIGHKNLYLTSGHYEKYGKDSFQSIKTPQEGEEFILKPMNCPHHCEIYKTKPRSYKDLPLRLAEFGTVYRYEQHGELHGLTRVRGFTQDDAHLFCRPDQVKEEFTKVIDLVLHVFNKLNFKNYTAQISLRDKEDTSKYIGAEENWNLAEQAIIESAKERGLKTIVKYGEAAFYGPKLDFIVQDALGRKWQLGTIQVDYNLPDRFELEYIGADNQKHRPVMIHRAPFGSLERFIAVLIEHCAGNFPIWLAPIQAILLPINEKQENYCLQIEQQFKQHNIRIETDFRSEKIGKKIRDAELKKIPFMLIIGDKEMQHKAISIRRKGMGDIGTMSIEDTLENIIKTIENIYT
ncbi:MAG: threonine--tRNA ligase [Chitinophagaceae bacterium]